MSFFPLDHPYYQQRIEDYQEFSPLYDNNYQISENLLVSINDERTLLRCLRDKLNNSNLNFSQAFVRCHQEFPYYLNLLLELQESKVNISLIELAKLSEQVDCYHTRTYRPFVLDFFDEPAYFFSLFQAKNKSLFIYTLSHLFQDRIEKIQEIAKQLKMKISANSIYDIDRQQICSVKKGGYRNFYSSKYRFVTDDALLGEIVELYQQFPEILVRFDFTVPSEELASTYHQAIKRSFPNCSYRQDIWENFFLTEDGYVLPLGNCTICNRRIECDNWDAKKIDTNLSDKSINNIIPCCHSCSLSIGNKHVVKYLIANNLNCLAAKHLNVTNSANA